MFNHLDLDQYQAFSLTNLNHHNLDQGLGLNSALNGGNNVNQANNNNNLANVNSIANNNAVLNSNTNNANVVNIQPPG